MIKNFSATGAGLLIEVRLAAAEIGFERGTIVTLTIDRFGDFPGQVAWQDQDKLGVAFMRDPEEVYELIRTFLHREQNED